MKPPRLPASSGQSLALPVTLLAIALSGVAWESRILFRGRDEAVVLQLHAAELVSRIGGQRTEIERLKAQLQVWEADVGTKSGSAGETPEVQVNRWADQLIRYRKFFADHPDQTIPDLSLLSDLDWLRLARAAQLEDPETSRQAFAAARNEARTRFSDLLSAAMTKYRAAHDNLLPASTGELADYLKPGVDPSLLGRYRMILNGRVPDSTDFFSAEFFTTEMGPAIDERYDSRYYIGPSVSVVQTWLGGELQDSKQEARIALAKANGGPKHVAGPTENIAELLPYITSPVHREYLAATVAYAGSHGGAAPSKAEDLFPYLGSVEGRSFAERLFLR